MDKLHEIATARVKQRFDKVKELTMKKITIDEFVSFYTSKDAALYDLAGALADIADIKDNTAYSITDIDKYLSYTEAGRADAINKMIDDKEIVEVVLCYAMASLTHTTHDFSQSVLEALKEEKKRAGD